MRYWRKLPYVLNRKLKPLRLVTRDEWGALPATEGSKVDRLKIIQHPVPRVIVAYTEDKMCNTEEECKERLRELQKRDMDEGLPDIRYNFLFGGDGNAYEGRGWLYCPKESGSWPEWHSCFVLLALTVLLAVAEGVCPSNERHYYEGIGCVPQDTDQNGCVTSYDCSSLAGRRVDRCYHKGQDYPEGAILPTTPDTACLAHCRCVNSTFHSRFLFDCVRVECPEHLGARPGPGCYYVYEHDRCCGVKKVCVLLNAESKSQQGCEVDGRTFKHGQKFFPEAEQCLTCICKPGFNGAFVEPFCRKVACNLELVAADRLAKGCVPVYYGEEGCCPIDWRCPGSTDTVVSSPQTSRSSTAKTCQFGSLTLQVGDALSDSPQHRGVQCSCRVPPHLVCVQPPSA